MVGVVVVLCDWYGCGEYGVVGCGGVVVAVVVWLVLGDVATTHLSACLCGVVWL